MAPPRARPRATLGECVGGRPGLPDRNTPRPAGGARAGAGGGHRGSGRPSATAAYRPGGVPAPGRSQVRKLEELLGVALFERTSKTVAPTVACERLIGHVRAAVAEADAILAVARDVRDPLAGGFRLGATPTVAPYLLPLVFAPLRGALPALEVEPWEDQNAALLERLPAHELDAALLATESLAVNPRQQA
jgi:LysR substrate binding domain